MLVVNKELDNSTVFLHTVQENVGQGSFSMLYKKFQAAFYNKGVTVKSSSISVHYMSLNKFILEPTSNICFFPLQAELKGQHSTLQFIIVPMPLAQNQQKTSSTHRTRYRPVLTGYLSWWPLFLLPCYQMELVSTGTQNNLTHLLCVNRWTVRRWAISHGARIQKHERGRFVDCAQLGSKMTVSDQVTAC